MLLDILIMAAVAFIVALIAIRAHYKLDFVAELVGR